MDDRQAEPSVQGSPAGDGGLSPWIWGFGLVAIVGVLWYLFGR